MRLRGYCYFALLFSFQSRTASGSLGYKGSSFSGLTVVSLSFLNSCTPSDSNDFALTVDSCICIPSETQSAETDLGKYESPKSALTVWIDCSNSKEDDGADSQNHMLFLLCTLESQNVSCLTPLTTKYGPGPMFALCTALRAVSIGTIAAPDTSDIIFAIATADRSPVNPPGPIEITTNSNRSTQSNVRCNKRRRRYRQCHKPGVSQRLDVLLAFARRRRLGPWPVVVRVSRIKP